MDSTDIRINKFRSSLKRWLPLILGIILLFCAGAFLLYRFTDITFFMPTPSDISYSFRTSERTLERRVGTQWEAFTVRGTETPASYSDAGYDECLSMLSGIAEMNANAVRVHTLMSADFYRALFDLNKSGRTLYLMQGIELEDNVFSSMSDMRTGGMVSLFKKSGYLIMDAVHGNKPARGYRTDVSAYTLAYIVGDKWNSELVLYTDKAAAGIAGLFSGSYACAWRSAAATPTLISEVVDAMFAYETKKYAEQHLIGLGNTQKTDLLFHDTSWALGLNENIAAINTAQISVTQKVKTGIFAACRIDIGTMLNMSCDPSYLAYTDSVGRRDPAQYYLQELYNAYRIPVMLSATASASNGCSGIDSVKGYDRGGTGEKAQAEALCDYFTKAIDTLWCGGTVGYFADDLTQRAWNTPAVFSQSSAWQNVQDSEQCLGLNALQSEKAVCTVDGDASEWSDTPILVQGEGMYMQAANDSQYLYLHIHVDAYAKTDVIYVPFDITPLSGAASCPEQQLSFDRGVDLLLSINYDKRAKLSVQEYYDVTAALSGRELYGTLPYVSAPARDSTAFVSILQYARAALRPVQGDIVDAVLKDAGILRFGNADPAAAEYDSLAMYCIDTDDIEVRIPWALLNITDPTAGNAIGDLYDPQARVINVKSLYAALQVYKDSSIHAYDSTAFEIVREDSLTLRRRASYYALQELFKDMTK